MFAVVKYKLNLKNKLMSITTNLETITPERAQNWLDEHNVKNRPINETNLQALLHDMKTDNFHLTGETIKFASNGDLLDGQHRLMAIAKSKKPCKMMVMRGLSSDAFKYIDTGRTRKASDVLGIEGIKNPSKIAAMVKFIITFKAGKYTAMKSGNKQLFIRNADVSEFVEKNRDSLFQSYPYGFNKYNKVVSSIHLASLHYIFKSLSPADADEFCDRVADGENLSKTNVIYLLRQKLTNDMRSTRKMPPIERMALICKAWNIFRGKSRAVTILKWDSIKEPFPKPM